MDGGGGDAQAGLGRLEGDIEAHLDRALTWNLGHRMIGRRMRGHDNAPGDIKRVKNELGGGVGIEPIGRQRGAAGTGQEATRHAS